MEVDFLRAKGNKLWSAPKDQPLDLSWATPHLVYPHFVYPHFVYYFDKVPHFVYSAIDTVPHLVYFHFFYIWSITYSKQQELLFTYLQIFKQYKQ